jgi:hypothetical protein
MDFCAESEEEFRANEEKKRLNELAMVSGSLIKSPFMDMTSFLLFLFHLFVADFTSCHVVLVLLLDFNIW